MAIRALSLGAFLGLAVTRAIFWIFTYPMNMASQFWTVLPEPFEAARRQWEYSHAASAVLTFASLIAITLSVLLRSYTKSRSCAVPLGTAASAYPALAQGGIFY